MLSNVSGIEIFRAYQILFAPTEHVFRSAFSLSSVKELEPSSVKNAFRKKAFETHPDRAKISGREEDEQARLFRQVQRAYEILMPVAENRHNAEKNKKQKNRSSERTNESARFNRKQDEPIIRKPSSYYSGLVPNYKMKLGHFLYYSGMISWQHLISAVAWQMRSRPRYGEIATGWNIVSHEEIMNVLAVKPFGEKIGEALRSRELISDFQHLAIMGKQKKYHTLFGQFFVREGIISQRQLDIALRRIIRHNDEADQRSFRFRG